MGHRFRAVPFPAKGGVAVIRRLMWFTIGFGAACALGAYCYRDSLWILAVAALIFAVFALIWKRKKALWIIGTLFLGLAVGLGWFIGFDKLNLEAARELDGQQGTYEVEVRDYSYDTDYGSAVEGYIRIQGKRYRIWLYRQDTEALSPGDRVCCNIRLRFTAHGGSEEPTYHRGNGIFLLGYTSSAEAVVHAEKVPLKYLPAVLRRGLLRRIDECFPEDTAFFAKGLLLGDRAELDYATQTSFKNSGIMHIIAVSGLHVSILFGMIYLITCRQRVLTAIVGIPVVFLFAAVAGFTPSVTRASIMQCLLVLSMLLDEDYDAGTSLAFAALAMLVADPMVITSVSFQLSVGCMAGIFLFSDGIRSWFLGLRPWRAWSGKTRRGRLIRWLASSVSISVGSMFFTTPLMAIYFGSVSLVGIVTNVLVLYPVTLIFYGVVLVSLLSLFWLGGGKVLAWICAWPIRYVLAVAKTLASFPLSAVYTKSIYIVIWLILCYILIFLFLATKKREPYVLICCGVIGFCLALVCSWAEPMLDNTRLTVLDVGQGQSLILQCDGRTFLIDCGGDSDTAAADMAAETLLSQGIFRLDGLIVTHYDRDHAGGVSYFLSRVPADVVFMPDVEDSEGIKAEILRAAETVCYVDSDRILQWNGETLTLFAPLLSGEDNESGLCILLEGQTCAILITGDLSIKGESLLLQHRQLPELTALIAGHHGSKYSTGEELLRQTRPEYAFISVGENSYGHPSEEVLERLKNAGCRILRTDQYGTIVFRR